MKKSINKMFVLVMSLALITTGVSAQPRLQEKTDKLFFLDGSVKEGKVVAFANEKVRFVYKAETLNYEFSRSDIERIEYASGRTEMITVKKVIEIQSAPVISKNKVAVIPMQYMGNISSGNKEDMSFYLQEIATNYLSKSAAELKFQDVAEVNAVLLKNGITDSSIRKYTPKELAAILHVEYIIMGSVLQDNGRTVTNASGNKIKKQDSWDYGDYKRKEKYQETIVTNQMVETQVTLSIYNETGEKIYGKSRHSLLSEQDAYKNTIHYLLKRTPLYKR